MDNKNRKEPKTGQGYNDARGEIPDKKDIPKNNAQNLDNDPAHQAEREKNRQDARSRENVQ